MKSKPIPTKQNLFLFLEENELKCTIDKKLVFFYANRCIIDEDAQFEICGVYNLQYASDGMIDPKNPLYKTKARQRTLKEANDRETISEAFEIARSNESASTDTHFIIGSLYHSVSWKTPSVLNRANALKNFMFNELKSAELKTIYVTLIAGLRGCLMTKRRYKKTYDGKTTITISYVDQNSPQLKCSVNDDFELAKSLIRNGRRLNQMVEPSFFLPMLTPLQLKLVQAKDESFLQMFANHLCGGTVDVSKEELEESADLDHNQRFEICVCVRESFYLK